MVIPGEKITYVEYFMLPNEVDETCDWESEFGVHNYFIDGIGFTCFETDNGPIFQIFDDKSKSFKTNLHGIQQFVDVISKGLNSDELIPSDLRNSDFICGLSQTAISGDNDIASVYEYLGDTDVDFEYDTDNVSNSYANHFGCRVWELDVSFEIDTDDGEVVLTDDGEVVLSNIDYDGESYDTHQDAFEVAEYEDVKKTIAIVSKEYNK
jgi:hypothetical protein